MQAKLLLHLCCGPCGLMPVSRLLEEGYSVTAWFMNPNVQPLAEYLRRREAAGQCAEHFGIPILYADETWDITRWLRAVQGRDEAPERCAYCVTSRVQACYQACRDLGFDCVSTSLLYSRYQPHEVIAQAGRTLAAETGIPFVYRDFRSDWQAGIDLSRTLGLYRQPYCGCVYSEAERYQKKLDRLVAQSASPS